MTLKLYFFGGISEVGGNKILVDDNGTKIFLDFGISYSKKSMYFDLFVAPRSIGLLEDLGIIPRIKDLYSQALEDYFCCGKELDFDKDPEPPVDAVFISHAHMDHIGHISLLSRKTRIYMGDCAQRILEARAEAYRGSRSIDLVYDGLFDNIGTFHSFQRINIGHTEIIPVHVDHSIPGAYGFIIRTSEGKDIVYTGDLRWHGEQRLTDDFVRELEKIGDVDCLITECTHVDYSGYVSEAEVMQKARSLVESFDGNFIVDFSRTDYDRFFSFWQVSKDTDTYMVVDIDRWFIIRTIMGCRGIMKKLEESNLIIYLTKRMFRKGAVLSFIMDLVERDSGRVLKTDSLINRELKEKDSEIAFLHDFLNNVRREGKKAIITIPRPGADILMKVIVGENVYIHACSEPISEESVITFEKLQNWLEIFGIPMYHIHSSGHITPLDLRKFVLTIEPKSIIPIHGERPGLLSRFIKKESINWILPQYGSPIEL